MNAPAPQGARPSPGPVLGLLAFLLAVWEPLTFGLTASAALPRLWSYGLPALLLLAVRIALTGVGLVLGRSLWQASPDAPRRARLWLALSSLASIVTFATPYFPSNRLPGTAAPTLAVILAHNLLWYLYLLGSRRVRAIEEAGSVLDRPTFVA